MSHAALAAALELLPHGPEFRFIDRVLDLLPGQSGVGEYTLRGDEAFLRGHLPGQPLLPGVLLLEAGAQLAGIVAQTDPSQSRLAGLKLAALRAVKIFGSVVPQETVRLEVRITGRLANLVQAVVSASAGSRLLMQGEVTLSGEPLQSSPPAAGAAS